MKGIPPRFPDPDFLLAEILTVAVEELIGQSTKAAIGKRGPAPRLQQQLDRLLALPKPKQRAVMEVLDATLAHANRQGAST